MSLYNPDRDKAKEFVPERFKERGGFSWIEGYMAAEYGRTQKDNPWKLSRKRDVTSWTISVSHAAWNDGLRTGKKHLRTDRKEKKS